MEAPTSVDDGLQDPNRMMEVSEVAVRLNSSSKTIIRIIETKGSKLWATRVGARWKVPVWAFKKYVEANSNKAVELTPEPEAVPDDLPDQASFL